MRALASSNFGGISKLAVHRDCGRSKKSNNKKIGRSENLAVYQDSRYIVVDLISRLAVFEFVKRGRKNGSTVSIDERFSSKIVGTGHKNPLHFFLKQIDCGNTDWRRHGNPGGLQYSHLSSGVGVMALS